jgi:hypothetical protein
MVKEETKQGLQVSKLTQTASQDKRKALSTATNNKL